MKRPNYFKVKIDLENRMTVCSINIPTKYLVYIEQLITWGITPSRSEYIRNATKQAIKNDFDFIKQVDNVIEEESSPDSVKVPLSNGEIKEYKILRRLE